MKIASFFVALLVGALSVSDSVAAGDDEDVAEVLVLSAPPPQHDSCAMYGSAYTGKSGKSMSMGKSGKGLRTSKSSKRANSEQELGIGTITITFDSAITYGTDYYENIRVDNVKHLHCAGELMLWLGELTVDAGLFEQKFVLENGTVISKDNSLLELGLLTAGVSNLTWMAEQKAAAIISEENGPVRRA